MINEFWTKWQLWPKNVITQKLQSLYNFISTLVCPALQCIFTASEDCNESSLANLMLQEHLISSLRFRPNESHEDLHIQLLAQGIMLNITISKGETTELLLPEVIESISKVLSQDQRSLVRDPCVKLNFWVINIRLYF